MSFKWHAILSRVKKSHAISLCPTQDVTHPFVQLSTGLVPILVIRSGLAVSVSQCWIQETLIVHHKWPQSARIVMLAMQICQKEVVSS